MHSLKSIASSTSPKQSKPLYASMSALFFAGALAGCATYRKCGFSGCPDDAKITAKVEAELGNHPELDAPNRIAKLLAGGKIELGGHYPHTGDVS
jgi:hypothetical protein